MKTYVTVVTLWFLLRSLWMSGQATAPRPETAPTKLDRMWTAIVSLLFSIWGGIVNGWFSG